MDEQQPTCVPALTLLGASAAVLAAAAAAALQASGVRAACARAPAAARSPSATTPPAARLARLIPTVAVRLHALAAHCAALVALTALFDLLNVCAIYARAGRGHHDDSDNSLPPMLPVVAASFAPLLLALANVAQVVHANATRLARTFAARRLAIGFAWHTSLFWTLYFAVSLAQLAHYLGCYAAHVSRDPLEQALLSAGFLVVFYARLALLAILQVVAAALAYIAYTRHRYDAHLAERLAELEPLTNQELSDAEKYRPPSTFGDFYEKFCKLIPFVWPAGDAKLQLMISMCFVILICGRVVNVFVPVQYKAVIDGLGGMQNGSPMNGVPWGAIIVFVLLRFLQGGVGILQSTQNFLWIPVGQFTTKHVSVKMFEHLHNLSMRFHLNRKTGEILRVQDRGVSSIVALLSLILFNIVPTLVDIFIACVYFTLQFDLVFGTIVFVTMALYITATILITEWRTKFRRETNDLDNIMEAKAVDSLLNVETVKYYNAEKLEVAGYADSIDAYQKADFKSQMTLTLLNTTQNIVIQGGLLVGCLLCAKRIIVDKDMSVSDFVLYLTYLTQLYAPLNYFGTSYRIIQKNFVDMEKMLDLLDEPPEIRDAPGAKSLELTQGHVVFDRVSFAYDPRLATLQDVSFSVPPNSTVALVGSSGSGKSTILRLLFRFYDVTSGRVLVDGQDVRDVTQTSLRGVIGVVPQDTVLFNDTIRYNIRYGRPGASDAEVEEAAKAAQIHDRIMDFPDGYSTMVGERGLRLSGGEKQRVAIARTLLKNPAIVLLDEATSALDTQTERHIQLALQKMTQNRTTLVIAHRLSTIITADQILVVNEGRIVERGSHAQLLKNKAGVYHDMWMKQLREDEIVNSPQLTPAGTVPHLALQQQEPVRGVVAQDSAASFASGGGQNVAAKEKNGDAFTLDARGDETVVDKEGSAFAAAGKKQKGKAKK